MRQCHHHCIEDPVTRQQAGAHRGRRQWIEDAALRCGYLDRPRAAIVDRHVRVGQHRFQARDRRRLGRSEGIVHIGFYLRVRAREIDLDPIAVNRQLGFDAYRFLPDAVVVQHRFARIGTIRHGADGAADPAFGIIQHLNHGGIDGLHAELAAQLAHTLRADGVGGKLRIEIANCRVRHAHIGSDETLKPAAAPIAGEAVFCRRKDESFLVNVSGIRIQARRTAAEIDVVDNRGTETN